MLFYLIYCIYYDAVKLIFVFYLKNIKYYKWICKKIPTNVKIFIYKTNYGDQKIYYLKNQTNKIQTNN